MTTSVPEELWPDTTNPAYAPFWAAARRHELAIAFCGSCGSARWPPRAYCPRCHAESVRWRAIDPVGTVHTYSVMHRAFSNAYRDWVPYAAVVVSLCPGVRMLGRLRAPADVVCIDLAVRAVFDDVSPDITIIDWEPRP